MKAYVVVIVLLLVIFGSIGGFLYNLSVRLTGGLLVGFQNS